MDRKSYLVLLVLLCVFALSCTDAKKARLGGYGNEFKIELMNCDGSVAQTWISSGKVDSKGNGYYFKEKNTGKLIQLTGSLVITEQ